VCSSDLGTLWAWGSNDAGQLGDGTAAARLLPVQVVTSARWLSGDTRWAAVAAGGRHTVAVRVDGSLWTWGANDSGQLGNGTTAAQLTPAQVGASRGWSSVAAGGNHTLAVRRDGTLWAWGNNQWGQLGDSTGAPFRAEPVMVGTDRDWVAAAASWDQTVARKADGTLWSWGSNDHGKLGDGTNPPQQLPESIP
jgi:alpha-tubulin suppressor-like RCC1 family protein